MGFLSDLAGFVRLATGLPGFLAEPLSLPDAIEKVRHGMRNREAALLAKVRQAIFDNQASPYRKLFRFAGCEFGDVERMVRSDGVEGALRRLLDAGVYVSYEEFKGRKPVVRGNQTFEFRARDFDNPFIRAHISSSTGGSSGRPARIRIDLEHIAQSAPHWALWFASHGWLDRPLIVWTPNHPGIASRQLLAAKFGKRFVKWFVEAKMSGAKDRFIAACVHAVVRRAAGFPKPEFVRRSETGRVGEYLVAMLQRGEKPCVTTSPSSAVYLSEEMQRRGISIANVTFLLGAEPVTPARKQSIEACGAKAVPTYGFSEGGNVGSQCPRAAVADEIHVSLDAYAVIQRPVQLDDERSVNALMLTALRPACPKVLFNTEIGDSATAVTGACDCLLGEMGYHLRLHTIRSFEKLTGEGLALLGTDFYPLMESVLPARFGGGMGHYQFVEHLNSHGRTQYRLLIHPDAGPLDAPEVKAVFLEELGNLPCTRPFMPKMWEAADVIRVERRPPYLTPRGKILPVRMLGAADPE